MAIDRELNSTPPLSRVVRILLVRIGLSFGTKPIFKHPHIMESFKLFLEGLMLGNSGFSRSG